MNNREIRKLLKDNNQKFALSTPALPPPTTTRSPLVLFNLLDFPWTKPLLSISEKALVFEFNNTTQKLLLSDAGTEPMDKDVDTQCTNAVGGAGLCVYLTRCEAAKTITSEAYKDTFCRVEGSYAGVCCPQTSVTNARVKSEDKLASESSSDKPHKEGKETSIKA